jgi:hypothetical protein
MTLGEHLSPFHVRQVAITTPMSASECVERLRGDLAPWYAFWGVPQQLKGSVDESGFSLRRYTGARKQLPSQARGRFEPDGHGTRLQLSIGWRFADLAALSLAVIFLAAASVVASRSDPRVAWLPYVLLPVLVVASVLHRLATFHDDDWMVAHLCELLQGTQAPAEIR